MRTGGTASRPSLPRGLERGTRGRLVRQGELYSFVVVGVLTRRRQSGAGGACLRRFKVKESFRFHARTLRCSAFTTVVVVFESWSEFSSIMTKRWECPTYPAQSWEPACSYRKHPQTTAVFRDDHLAKGVDGGIVTTKSTKDNVARECTAAPMPRSTACRLSQGQVQLCRKGAARQFHDCLLIYQARPCCARAKGAGDCAGSTLRISCWLWRKKRSSRLGGCSSLLQYFSVDLKGDEELWVVGSDNVAVL